MLVRTRIAGLLFLGALAACGGSPPPAAPPPVPTFGAQSGYARVSDEIVDWFLSRHPVHATSVGEHAYDTTLGSYFAGDLVRATRDARALLTRLQGVNRPTLERPQYFDHRLLEYGLRAELLDLEELGGWQRDPIRYVDLAATASEVFGAEDIDLAARARVAIARWRQVPLIFRAARQNLVADQVPPFRIRAAAFWAAATLGHLRDDAMWASSPGLASLSARDRRELDDARALAAASVDSFAAWLETDLGPRARGDFRLGAEGLRDLLRYRFHEATPLEDMQAINRQAIGEYREWMQRVALEIDPLRHPDDIVDSLLAADPGAGEPDVLPDAGSRTRVRAALPPIGRNLTLEHYRSLAEVQSEAASNPERLLAIHHALSAHALLHAMIMLHAGGATIDAVATDIASIASVDLDQARAMAEAMVLDPGYGLAALHRMQLFALHAQLRASRGGDYDTDAFLAELRALDLPVPLAAEALLGHEPQPLLVLGRRTPGIPEPPRRLQ